MEHLCDGDTTETDEEYITKYSNGNPNISPLPVENPTKRDLKVKIQQQMELLPRVIQNSDSPSKKRKISLLINNPLENNAPLQSSHQPRKVSCSNVSILLNTGPSKSEESIGKPQRLYCICQAPYEPDKFMIGCDGCDQWFHGSCVGIDEEEGELVDKYFCLVCTNKGFVSSWKKRCQRKKCKKPAKVSVDSKGIQHTSKYCSKACGLKVAKKIVKPLLRLKMSSPNEKESKKSQNIEENPPMEDKKEEILIQSPTQKSSDEDSSISDGIPPLPLRSKAINNLLANTSEFKKLYDAQEYKRRIKISLDLIEKRLQLIQHCAERAYYFNTDNGKVGLTSRVFNRNGRKEASQAFSICGFDPCLLEPLEEQGTCNDIEIGEDTSEDILKRIEGQLKERGVCFFSAKKCLKHTGWPRLRILEVEQAKQVQMARLGEINLQIGKLKRQIERRKYDLLAESLKSL